MVVGGGRDHGRVVRTYIHPMTAGGFLNLLTGAGIIVLLPLILMNKRSINDFWYLFGLEAL